MLSKRTNTGAKQLPCLAHQAALAPTPWDENFGFCIFRPLFAHDRSLFFFSALANLEKEISHSLALLLRRSFLVYSLCHESADGTKPVWIGFMWIHILNCTSFIILLEMLLHYWMEDEKCCQMTLG